MDPFTVKWQRIHSGNGKGGAKQEKTQGRPGPPELLNKTRDDFLQGWCKPL